MTYSKAHFFAGARHLALASAALLNRSKKETDTMAPAGPCRQRPTPPLRLAAPFIAASTKAPGTTWNNGCIAFDPNSDLARTPTWPETSRRT